MRWVLCLTMFAALGFAPAPVYKPRKAENKEFDIDKIQGTWQSSSWRREGRQVDKRATWKFSKNTLDVHQGREAIGFTWLVDTRRSPKTLALKLLGRIQYRVICKLMGDTLTVCFNETDATTPEAFQGDGKGQNLIVFERRKDR